MKKEEDMKTLTEAYWKGLNDALKLIESGVEKGLSLSDSVEILKSAVTKTFEEVVK